MRAPLILDTETTGLIANASLPLDKQPEVIEFYGARVNLDNGGEILEDYHTLIKPKSPLTAEQMKHVPIDNEMLADAPTFAQVAENIRAIIEPAPFVIAHNLSFDMEIIDFEYLRLDEIVKWPRPVCTIEQTVHIKGFRLNLTALHEYLFGVPFSGAHRANVDVAALIRCCVELRKRDIL
jgi:DNA polymerase-3 subunit alpha